MIKLDTLCRQSSAGDQTALGANRSRIKEFGLTTEEEYFLVSIYPPDLDNFSASLDLYERKLPIIRGQTDIKPWVDYDEISKLKLNRSVLSDEEMENLVLRSVFVWYLGDYPNLAVCLIDKFDGVTDGDFTFVDLEDSTGSFYLRISTFLFVRYMHALAEYYQLFFFQSTLFLLAANMGLDLESAVINSVDSSYIIEERKKLCVALAVALYTNPSVIGGKPEDGMPADVAYWIDKFKVYSNGKFDGMSLTRFLNDTSLWKYAYDYEKKIIEFIIKLYVGLVGGFYASPSIDDINLEKKIKQLIPDVHKIKEYMDIEFGSDENGQYYNMNGVLERLQEYATNYKDPSLAELYYFDEGQNKFVWKE